MVNAFTVFCLLLKLVGYFLVQFADNLSPFQNGVAISCISHLFDSSSIKSSMMLDDVLLDLLLVRHELSIRPLNFVRTKVHRRSLAQGFGSV